MGQNPTPSKPGFKHPIAIGNIIEVYWWGFGGKRSSDRLVARAHVRYLCQNRPKNRGSAPSSETFPCSMEVMVLEHLLFWMSGRALCSGSLCKPKEPKKE